MNNVVNFFAIIVIYNQKITDSMTYKNLKDIVNHNIKIVIVDNSTQITDNSTYCKNNNIVYLSKQENIGLSKGYNMALDYLKNEDGVVIWFDDDTNITDEYFHKLEEAVLKFEDCDIFVPIIEGQDGKFWSPNESRYLRNKQIKNTNQKVSDKRFNAINSCTAVRLKVYEKYRYDEKLFLDQVDHQFFEDQRKLNRKFFKIDVIIHHNFSTKSKMKNIDAVKDRYRIMIPDFMTFSNKGIKRYLLGLTKVAGWGIREGIKYRSSTFLFWCFKQVHKWSVNRKS